MPAAIIPAIIGGVGAIGGALISSHAVNSAANTEANAAAADNALQLQIYNSNKALEQPYITGGNTAEDELSGFLGLGGDPAASKKALDTYLNSTGYQFNLNQGLQAAQQDKAASGMLNSGSTLKALDAYGTGLADQYGQQYVGNLQNMVSTGANSANALAGMGENYANAANSNTNGAANASANASIAGANIDTSLINNAMGLFGKTIGGSSFGGGGGNAFGGGVGAAGFMGMS
ncbi:MAG: hypothetical protein ACRED8_03800 [Caulobacteraceae bacterium]